MDPDAIDAVTRVPHGGESDPELVDFSANTNPQTPDGVSGVYEAALSAAGRYPTDDYCEFRAAAADYIGVTGTEIIPTAGGLAGMRLLVPNNTGSVSSPRTWWPSKHQPQERIPDPTGRKQRCELLQLPQRATITANE